MQFCCAQDTQTKNLILRSNTKISRFHYGLPRSLKITMMEMPRPCCFVSGNNKKYGMPFPGWGLLHNQLKTSYIPPLKCDAELLLLAHGLALNKKTYKKHILSLTVRAQLVCT
eukprot:GEMP01101820.1.p1 GENE.GEMP01101820.1~~GEMP01101820.1.p1  ORF type:complete len:113 (-),score=1.83 GEMP01101820.1:214-552(-)